MKIIYTTNGAVTTKSMTEWFFGKGTVKNLTGASERIHGKTGESEFRYFINGTWFLGIVIK